MKNFEKYIDEIVGTLHKFSEEHYHESAWKLQCYFLMFDLKKHDHESIKQWLLEEYVEPIQLSYDEYVILKNLPNKIKYIVRDSFGGLGTYEHKPFRNCGLWCYINGVCRHVNLYAFDHLFQFIQWEDEPYSIEKLIADYEKEHKDE